MDPVSEIVPSLSIRVFLMMENRLLREALIRLLRKRSDLVVVGYDDPAPLLDVAAVWRLKSEPQTFFNDTSLDRPRDVQPPAHGSGRRQQAVEVVVGAKQ